jgi:hypothetical protein
MNDYYCYIHRCHGDGSRCGDRCYQSKVHKSKTVESEAFPPEITIPACGTGGEDSLLTGVILDWCFAAGELEKCLSEGDLEKLDLCKRCFKRDLGVLDRMAGI